jgi:hypothetical protein
VKRCCYTTWSCSLINTTTLLLACRSILAYSVISVSSSGDAIGCNRLYNLKVALDRGAFYMIITATLSRCPPALPPPPAVAVGAARAASPARSGCMPQ